MFYIFASILYLVSIYPPLNLSALLNSRVHCYHFFLSACSLSVPRQLFGSLLVPLQFCLRTMSQVLITGVFFLRASLLADFSSASIPVQSSIATLLHPNSLAITMVFCPHPHALSRACGYSFCSSSSMTYRSVPLFHLCIFVCGFLIPAAIPFWSTPVPLHFYLHSVTRESVTTSSFSLCISGVY